eukprot:scaffold544_cov117-Isochrysis_galbana.AAC.14
MPSEVSGGPSGTRNVARSVQGSTIGSHKPCAGLKKRSLSSRASSAVPSIESSRPPQEGNLSSPSAGRASPSTPHTPM